MAEMRNWLVYGIVNRELRRALSVYAKGKLLDIGCGDKPYQGMAAPYVQEHIGLDHPGTLHDASRAELIGGAYDIPLDDDSVDTVLCTAVLEHLEEPEKALREAYRVLKEGGYAIYTVPLFWHLHEEPRDFYRFTKYGLRYLFEKSGFRLRLRRHIPFVRSPTSSIRFRIVVSVNISGRTDETSSQSSGADARASGVGRIEYADAIVRSREFWP